MDWLKNHLRRWLEVPEVIQYIPYMPSAEVVAAVGYQDMGIFIFTKRGQVYRLDINRISEQPTLIKLMIEVPSWP